MGQWGKAMVGDAPHRDRVGNAPAPNVPPAQCSQCSAAAGEVTRILVHAAHGSTQAAEQLLPLVYDELRRLAAQRLAGEKPGQSLQATALVHEAYLRLVCVDQARQWDGRNHFFVAAAEAMRRILVENARRKGSVRHGRDFRRQEMELERLPMPEAEEEVLAIDEALVKLSAERPEVAKLVQLRYFAGLALEEAAALLGISPRTAHRYWSYARAWLRQELVVGPHPPASDGF